ncbi:hypothetical protein BCR33DRAFT_791513 [Rhizoclosmatium globosum]|uniref:TIR domain-containing protein n=1 Tax=Rhizoclosmatium globosum TaxID=329046 RepID=A0A1Y2BGT2_9FUNG|nr:hypothetical protein BCR33DRAFT_791513 [Rhizoclosmatium globosum]|eukprot:ORY33295.1 hypothetical protein BCR33DRAFT_791513 [Rhizoclosmatium globosum]
MAVAFVSEEYCNSRNCLDELKFIRNADIPILFVVVGKKTAFDWRKSQVGFMSGDSLYIEARGSEDVFDRILQTEQSPPPSAQIAMTPRSECDYSSDEDDLFDLSLKNPHAFRSHLSSLLPPPTTTTSTPSSPNLWSSDGRVRHGRRFQIQQDRDRDSTPSPTRILLTIKTPTTESDFVPVLRYESPKPPPSLSLSLARPAAAMARSKSAGSTLKRSSLPPIPRTGRRRANSRPHPLSSDISSSTNIQVIEEFSSDTPLSAALPEDTFPSPSPQQQIPRRQNTTSEINNTYENEDEDLSLTMISDPPSPPPHLPDPEDSGIRLGIVLQDVQRRQPGLTHKLRTLFSNSPSVEGKTEQGLLWSQAVLVGAKGMLVRYLLDSSTLAGLSSLPSTHRLNVSGPFTSHEVAGDVVGDVCEGVLKTAKATSSVLQLTRASQVEVTGEYVLRVSGSIERRKIVGGNSVRREDVVWWIKCDDQTENDGSIRPIAVKNRFPVLIERARETSIYANVTDFESAPFKGKKDFDLSLSARCVRGELDCLEVIHVSSGSGGVPTFWGRNVAEELAVAVRFEHIFRDAFNAHELSTLVVVALPMGSWSILSLIQTDISLQKGYKISVISPGNNIPELLRVITSLSPSFHQTVIAGYPPFVKTLIDQGSPSTSLGQLSPPLHLRRRSILRRMAHPRRNPRWNPNPSQKHGLHLRNSRLRRPSQRNSPNRHHPQFPRVSSRPDENLFGKDRIPSFMQYDPLNRYFERHPTDGSLVVTTMPPPPRGDMAMPLVRYCIGDDGNEDSKASFVWVFGRAFWTVSMYGANVYVENIMVGLEQPDVCHLVTGKFVLGLNEDPDDLRLLLRVELAIGVDAGDSDGAVGQKIAASVTKELKRLNSEFANYVPEEKHAPIVHLYNAGDATYFPVGVKHSYIKK